ncbi:hypothetical protein JCM10449v2_002618 [Rhodotorula kratochvilovae]
MASSSPPPPPDPNRLNPFHTGCGAATPHRAPALRRSKTLANPESPTRWRREPLTDVTNAVLGREGTGRLQRVDVDLFLPLPSFSPATRGPAAENTPSSPTPSRIPRSTALRRTRSAAPTFGAFSSPSSVFNEATPLARDGVASPTPAGMANAPTRELRPRPRPAGTLVPSSPTARRARTADSGATLASPSAPSTRRRTFGGVAALPAVIEDEPASSPSALQRAGATTPMTRSRSLSEGETEIAGEGERRLRRRRTTGGAEASSPSTRRGLR